MLLLVFLSLLLVTSVADESVPDGVARQDGHPKAKLAKDSPIDLSLAKIRFDEAKRLAEADHGRLWGKSLDGPKLFVDPRTRYIVTNQADTEGKLKPEAGVFVRLSTTQCTHSQYSLQMGRGFNGRCCFGHYQMTKWSDPSCSCTNRGIVSKPI